jgi:hypothetical protein
MHCTNWETYHLDETGVHSDRLVSRRAAETQGREQQRKAHTEATEGTESHRENLDAVLSVVRVSV